MNPQRDSQLMRVLGAFQNGAACVREVSEMTGIPYKHCLTYTCKLVAMGRLIRSGRLAHLKRHRGRPPVCYIPVHYRA